MQKIVENKTILIAGGAGFIGYHLISELLKYNNKIVVIDNLSTGNINNINDLKKINRFEFIEFDISNSQIVEMLSGYEFDLIYNLACPANPDYCFSHSLDVLKACIFGTYNLINIAIKSKARYIYFSTSEVYGDPLVPEQAETYFGNVNQVGLRACYEEGKRVAETICLEYGIKKMPYLLF